MQQIWTKIKYTTIVLMYLDPVRYLKILMFSLYVNSSVSFTYYITWAKGSLEVLSSLCIYCHHLYVKFLIILIFFTKTACLIDTKLGKNVPLQILCFCSDCKSMMTTNVETRGHIGCVLFFVCRVFFLNYDESFQMTAKNLQSHYIWICSHTCQLPPVDTKDLMQ